MADGTESRDWPSLARRLWDCLPAPVFAEGAAAALREAGCRRLLVACSGGADSVCLLCALWAWPEDARPEMVVAHYNHRWRGAASEADAAFVAEMAAGLALPFAGGERPEREAAFTETEARRLRQGFLRATAEAYGCGVIAFGHQRDDILETQLQRLARGAGSRGLAAPRPVHRFAGRPAHVRPLLHHPAGLLRSALRSAAVPWREDASNADSGIPRNRIRRTVVPELEAALSRDAGAGAARSRALLEEDAEALDTLARDRFPEAFSGAEGLARAALAAAPRGLARRALSAWLAAHGLRESLGPRGMARLLDVVRGGGERARLSVGSAFVVADARTVALERIRERPEMPETPLELLPGEPLLLPSGGVLEADWVVPEAAERARVLEGRVDPLTEAWLDRGEAAARLWVRRWLPGDRYRPLGAPGRRKLKRCFADAGIPRGERGARPVVLDREGGILWIPGLPPAEAGRLGARTNRALRLTYHPSKPR